MNGIEFLFALRSRTGNLDLKSEYGQSFKANAKEKLKKDLDEYILCPRPDSIEENNVLLIIGWLIELTAKQSIFTIHSALDIICRLAEPLHQIPINKILEKISEYLDLSNYQTNTQRKNRSFIYSLANYLTSTTGTKLQINLRVKKIQRDRTVRLIPGFSINEMPSKNEKEYWIIVIICALTGLRIAEILSLTPYNIIVTDQIYIFVYRGKGDKDRVAQSGKLPFKLKTILVDFINEKKRQKATYLFSISETGYTAAYQKVLYWLNTNEACDNTHAMRRLLANSLRAQNASLLEVANALGHSSVKTTAENYILIYPALQRKQQIEWFINRTNVYIPLKISIQANMKIQQVTREGFIKISKARENKLDCDQFPLYTSINLIRSRIIKISGTDRRENG
jgi:integrase